MRFAFALIVLLLSAASFAFADDELAAPREIELDGNIRRVSMSSPVGRFSLRWPRSAETLFGRSPERALAEAAKAASRALKASSFPVDVRTLWLDWEVVFMDSAVDNGQIPSALVSSCHPGWMTPPANIYIVAQRAATYCNGDAVDTSVADGRLAGILLHEMGHVIEYQLAKERFGNDRMRAEGFASWFEQYASEYASVMNSRDTRKYYADLARASFARNPGPVRFGGSGHDYARASYYFHALAARRGVRGIVDIYDTMRRYKLTFLQAVKYRTDWNEAQLIREARKVLSSAE